MAPHAERGLNAPPEVVVDVAVDPATRDAWLPGGVRVERGDTGDDTFEVRLSGQGDGPGGVLRVRHGDAGGSLARLEVADGGSASNSPEQMLDNLESQVVDRFNAG